jgi:hypothetical protein
MLLHVPPILSSLHVIITITFSEWHKSWISSFWYYLQPLVISSPCWGQIFPSAVSALPPYSSLCEGSGFTAKHKTYFPYGSILYEAVSASAIQVISESRTGKILNITACGLTFIVRNLNPNVATDRLIFTLNVQACTWAGQHCSFDREELHQTWHILCMDVM